MDVQSLVRRLSREGSRMFEEVPSMNNNPIDEITPRPGSPSVSKPECLLLSKNSSKSDLPAPCQLYIQQLQQSLAKQSDNDNATLLSRRKSVRDLNIVTRATLEQLSQPTVQSPPLRNSGSSNGSKARATLWSS